MVLEGPAPPFLDDLEGAAAVLAEAGPALTVVTISPFGRTGPRRDLPATEFTLQAWCGSIAWRGPEGLPPLQAGGDEGLWIAGAFAACAAAAGWRHAGCAGVGGRFDVSIFEAMALTLVCFPSVLRSFLGTDDPGGRKLDMPSVVAAADGWVGLCIVTREQWDTLLCMVERPDLLGDEELATAEGRKRRADDVQALVEAWTGVRAVADVLEQAARFRIPAAPLGSGRSVVEIDHFVARGTHHADPTGRFLAPRSPLRFDDRSPPASAPRAVPVAPPRDRAPPGHPARGPAARRGPRRRPDGVPGGPLRHAPAVRAGRRRREGRVDPASRPPALQRGRPTVGTALVRAVAVLPRGQPRQALGDARPRPPRRPGSPAAPGRAGATS